MAIRLDPRAKLYLLVLANLTLFLHVNLVTEVILVTLYLSLYFLAGKTKSGVRMTAVYAVLASGCCCPVLFPAATPFPPPQWVKWSAACAN